MAQQVRSAIGNFHGSKVTRMQSRLVKPPDCITMDNCDTSSGAVVPLKQDTLVDATVDKSFFYYNGQWRSTALEAEFLENDGKLYLSDGTTPRKLYTYLGNEYDEYLGIEKPGTEDASASVYYGSLHNYSYMDAWFIDPFVIGLRGSDVATAGSHLDVYQFTEDGTSLLVTATFASAHGTQLFCHVIDSTTIGVFICGPSAIKWYKFSISGNTLTAQTDITLGSGTFTCITGDHTSSNDGQWMSGAQSGSRWDSGWVMASSAEQLADGGNSWENTANIYAKDGNNAESGDVDTPETNLKSLIARFTFPEPPVGIDTFYVSVRTKYSWGSGSDWRWNTINRMQLYYGGWIGNNYAPVGIYQSKSGEYENIVSTGDWGVTNGITRDMITSGVLGFGLNFQSGNNGHWNVDYVEARIFGLVPADTEGEDKFEFFAGTTEGLNRYIYNTSTGVSLVDTTESSRSVASAYWDGNNISVLYTDRTFSLLNSYEVGGTINVLVEPTIGEPGSKICHDPFNEIYVGVSKSASDSGEGEVVCYDNDLVAELARIQALNVGTVFPTALCADDFRVYVSDDLGSYSDVRTFLNRSMDESGRMTGVFAGSSSIYGKCRSIRKCGGYIVSSLASTETNTFSGIWLYKANIEYLPSINHYSPSKANLNGVYSYGVTFYNERDGSESEMLLMIDDAYVIDGFIDIKNIPQPASDQATHIRLYRVGGSLSVFSLVEELTVGTTEYRDLVPDGETGDALPTGTRYQPPLNLRYITEAFGEFFGLSGTKLYFTTQANANYWTVFPIDLASIGTGIAPVAAGVLIFTRVKSYFLSGTNPDAFNLYPLSGDQGCVSGKSVQPFRDGALWISTDGLCFSNGGKPVVLSKELLGKISFEGIRASAVYDEVYYMAHSAGVFIADFRHDNLARFRDLADLDVDGMGVFEDILYFHKEGLGVFKAFAHATSKRRVTWRTGDRPTTDPASLKYYKFVKISYSGRPTFAVYVDGERVLNKVLAEAEEITDIDIDLPHVTAGRTVQYEIKGVFELHYFEEVADTNKR